MDWTKMGSRYVPAGILLAAMAGCICGCRLTPEFPPQPRQIVGHSYNPGIALQLIPPPQSDGDVTRLEIPDGGSVSASGDADMPAQALDPVQGRLVAKQMAKQAARRNLARKVEARQVQPGLTIGEAIRDDAQKRQAIENVLRNAHQRGIIAGDGGKCTVFLSVEIRTLNNVFLAGPAAEDSTSLTVVEVPPEQFRQRAQQEALDSARMRALEDLKGLVIAQNETLGMRMLRDDKLNRTVRGIVEDLRPIQPPQFREDGSCEVTLEIDLADIQRLVAPRRLRLWWPFKLNRFKRGSLWRRGG